MLVATTLLRRAWALPLASLVLVAVFYAAASVNGIDHAQLVAGGWLFDIPEEGGALVLLSGVSLDRVDTGFVVSVIPEILTIAFLALLTQSMSLSALLTSDREDIDTSREIAAMGQGNLLCALVASPPGSTDVAASSVYREFGASSRWMPLITSGVCVVMALFGSAIMPWVPKLLVGATVLLFAWQLFHEWMYENRFFFVDDTHDASGNPVAHDTVVGPPRHLQWSAAPRHSRSHEYTPSMAAMDDSPASYPDWASFTLALVIPAKQAEGTP